jgi:hypothetical protein
MKLRHKLGTFLAVGGSDRRLFCAAIAMLGMARFV